MGRILGPFGVRGWVKLRAFTESLESLPAYAVWQVGSGTQWRALQVEETEVHAAHVVAKLAGVDDRDQAFALRGLDVAVDRAELPAAADGEYYWADLIGLRVENAAGDVLGTIEDLMETGANDVLVVRAEGVERLLPYVEAIVLQVDLAAGKMLVDWGLDY